MFCIETSSWQNLYICKGNELEFPMSGSHDIIDTVVAQVAGQDVVRLVKALRIRKNVSEFKLAELLKEEVNLTRNMLYRLYNANLVSFTRKKDKKKGWYIYYWTFNTGRVKELLLAMQERQLEKLEERVHREKSSHFFICPKKCIRLDFEQATDFQYKCPECGALLDQEDNANKILQLEKEIQILRKNSKKK